MSASVEMITVAELETYAGVLADSDTARMTPIVSGVSEAIETYLGREVKTEEVTEYYDGYGYDHLVLDKWPIDRSADFIITEDTSVPRDFDSETALTTAQYLLDHKGGMVKRHGGNFPNGFEAVKVVYTAGLAANTAAVPGDIKLAAKMWCAAIYDKSKQGGDGIATERIGPYSVKFIEDAMPAGVPELLDKFKRRSI